MTLIEAMATVYQKEKKMADFKVGDTVRIKSALMPMTIVDHDDERAFCIWYNNDNDMKECNVPFACLALINPSDLKMP